MYLISIKDLKHIRQLLYILLQYNYVWNWGLGMQSTIAIEML